MKIINLGHASFKIENKKHSIIFDPYAPNSVPGLVFPKGIKADYVFSSHGHSDHNATELVVKVKPTEDINYKIKIVPHDNKGGALRGMCHAVIIELDGYRIAHLGDIGDPNFFDNDKDFQNLDIVLCPINGFYTIGAKEAIKLKEKLHARIMIPMHYEIKENRSGYPDGGQIDIFRDLLRNYYEVKDEIEIDDSLFKYGAIIFQDYKKGAK